MEAILKTLREVLGETAVLIGDDVRARPVSRFKQDGCAAGALVRPASTDEVALVMRLCHDITVLNFGRVLAQGSASAIQQDQLVIDAYLGQGTDVGAVQ